MLTIRTITLCIVIFLLSACGGGGGGKDPLSSAPSTSRSTNSVVSSVKSVNSLGTSSLATNSLSSSSIGTMASSTGSLSSLAPLLVPGVTGFPTTPTVVMPGTIAAPLGAPSTYKFNGLGIITDTLHHRPGHAIPAIWGAFPPALNTSTPSISDVAVLNRGDALIVYVPAVQGAADYRAYIYDSSKVTFSGTKPRGAVVACAGYRQRFIRNVDAFLANGPQFLTAKNRELLQAIEVPGLVTDGNYSVIVEALSSPCPFPGVMAHTNATIPVSLFLTSFNFRSFNDVISLYGNEILNGQGSTLADFTVSQSTAHGTIPAETVSLAVPTNDAIIPADPVVIARSAITVVRPALDEKDNAPIFDVGPNSHFDEFKTDAVMTSFRKEWRSEGAGLVSGGQFGDWFFWTVAVQPAQNAGGGVENGDNPKGAQVWTRHGRLYNTFSDWGQDIFGAMYFSSTKTRPQQLDESKYVHSFFRVDSGATERRYWHWMMCGADTPSETVNMTTGIPLGRPIAQSFFYLPGADGGGENPSNANLPLGDVPAAHHNQECLSLIQLGDAWNWGKPANATNEWYDEPHTGLMAFINPKGVAKGIVNLKTSMGDYDDKSIYPIKWRLNGDKHPTQPMFEPFDQQAPLTHFDVFARPDRVIFYVNGRQAWCADLTDRKLTMKYGHVIYGNVLYHSAAEIVTNYGGKSNFVGAIGGTSHYIMNTPWSDTRVWDAVGHSEKIDIPSQFRFDPRACFKPFNTAVQ
jgi:hypothetical protein